MGVTAMLGGRKTPALILAAYDKAYVPYVTWLGGDFFTVTGCLDDNGIMQGGMPFSHKRPSCCWNDANCIDVRIRKEVDAVRPSARHGVLAYSLGDEVAVRGSCLSPHCLDAYRRYLRSVYGDIETLNAEWGTSFSGFDKVVLSEPTDLPGARCPGVVQGLLQGAVGTRSGSWTRRRPGASSRRSLPARIRRGDVNDEVVALQAGNFPRWYDRQAFSVLQPGFSSASVTPNASSPSIRTRRRDSKGPTVSRCRAIPHASVRAATWT